jgi:hypothetical protein
VIDLKSTDKKRHHGFVERTFSRVLAFVKWTKL